MHPRMVPMGFTLAPFIAQCCTWSLLLAHTPGSKDHDALGPQKELLRKEVDPPVWLPLANGGGIFVLLDNILVVTPDEKTAEFWFNRIVDNCKEFHAVLKYESKEQLEGKELKDALRAQCFHQMHHNSPTSFNFYGVEWRHHEHRVPVKDPTRELPDYVKETRKFTTRRKLASVLGKLLWHRRIHRIKFFDGSDESDAIMNLYARYTPKDRAGWNEDIQISPAEEKGLLAAWKSRSDQTWLPARHLSSDAWLPSEVEWIATDAASETRTAAAVLLTHKETTTLSSEPDVAARSGSTVVTRKYLRAYGIAVAELDAIILAVEEILRRREKPPKLIVLATDSQNAKNWIEKGHAKNATAMKLLKKLDGLLQESRLYLVYINTKHNVADQPSREEHMEPARLVETIKVLSRASELAKGLWRISGDKVGGVAHLETGTGRREREE